MSNKYTLLILCALLFGLNSKSSILAEEELTVELTTEGKLLPIAMCSLETDTTLSPKIVKDLEQVFRFDLNYNGLTHIQETPQIKALYKDFGFAKGKEAGIYYFITWHLKNLTLQAKVFCINEGTTKVFDGITLSGNLSRDRKVIHQLSDAIFKLLSAKNGIATSRIFFTGENADGSSDVFEADYDGANVNKRTNEQALCVTPAAIQSSPTHPLGGLLYVSYRIGQPKIYFASFKDGKTRRFSTIRGNQLTPQISADGKKIAFACDARGCSDLFLQTFDIEVGAIGKPVQIYAAKGAAAASPTFSPDGKKIAFVSNQDGTPRIYVMDIPKEGSALTTLKPKLISKRSRENSAPNWSPDGTKLAYSAKVDSFRQIWIYDFATGIETQLTDGAGHKENPSFAPDSVHILFNRTVDKVSDLYLVNIHQTTAVKIASGIKNARFPCWKPKV